MYRKESGRVFRGLDYKKDNEDLRDYRYTSMIENNVNMKTFKATLPAIIDHTDDMSPVKDQG